MLHATSHISKTQLSVSVFKDSKVQLMARGTFPALSVIQLKSIGNVFVAQSEFLHSTDVFPKFEQRSLLTVLLQPLNGIFLLAQIKLSSKEFSGSFAGQEFKVGEIEKPHSQ